jgi:hypothetical protein
MLCSSVTVSRDINLGFSFSGVWLSLSRIYFIICFPSVVGMLVYLLSISKEQTFVFIYFYVYTVMDKVRGYHKCPYFKCIFKLYANRVAVYFPSLHSAITFQLTVCEIGF